MVSDEKFGDESKSVDTDSKSVELESAANELTELKESSIEHSNAREVQIDQLSLESDVKPTEPDRATDEVSAQQNSEVDATLSASEEQIEEASVAQEESVILQEEDLKMPKEGAEMIKAAANERHIEEEVNLYLLISKTKKNPSEWVSQNLREKNETDSILVRSFWYGTVYHLVMNPNGLSQFSTCSIFY